MKYCHLYNFLLLFVGWQISLKAVQGLAEELRGPVLISECIPSCTIEQRTSGPVCCENQDYWNKCEAKCSEQSITSLDDCTSGRCDNTLPSQSPGPIFDFPDFSPFPFPTDFGSPRPIFSSPSPTDGLSPSPTSPPPPPPPNSLADPCICLRYGPPEGEGRCTCIDGKETFCCEKAPLQICQPLCPEGSTCTTGECVSEQENKDCSFCPTLFEPVCCDDTITYSNSCEAECDGKTSCTFGNCQTETGECNCAQVSNPICERNTIDYINECERQCGRVFGGGSPPAARGGTCAECDCPDNFAPVCCQGNTYDNICVAGCDGFFIEFLGRQDCTLGSCGCDSTNIPGKFCCDGIQYENECDAEFSGCFDQNECGPQNCGCTTDIDPVCCAGGDSYSNLCSAQCDGIDTSTCVEGGCDACPYQCPADYLPVECGGRTFDNQCLAECSFFSEENCELLNIIPAPIIPGISPPPPPKNQICSCFDDEDGDEVCCFGNKEYSSKCRAECELSSSAIDFFCKSGPC